MRARKRQEVLEDHDGRDPEPESGEPDKRRGQAGRVRKYAITATAVITSSRTMPIVESPLIVVMRLRIRVETSKRERREDDDVPDCRRLVPRGEPVKAGERVEREHVRDTSAQPLLRERATRSRGLARSRISSIPTAANAASRAPAAWARRPAANVLVLSEQAARRSARTVNRMLTAVVGFYEFQGRRGNTLAQQLVVRTRSGRGSFKPFLHGIAWARPRGRPVRLPEQQQLPRTLSLEQVAAVIDCHQRLRDRFLFALLASTGMRVGQALGLRHEDIVSWERRIEIVPRADGRGSRARSKGGARGSVPVPGELIRLWSDYMHEEYGELESEFVFVNLWEGEIGRHSAMGRSMSWCGAPARRVGFHFTAHQLRHTYPTLAYRDGVALEVIGAVLTHRSPSSTLSIRT